MPSVSQLVKLVQTLDNVEFPQHHKKVDELICNGRYITLNQPHTLKDGIECYSTLRIQGMSKAPFDSFNMGLHVGDDAEVVLKNREEVCKDLKLKRLVFMNQTHSDRLLFVDNNLNEAPDFFDCDGLVTTLDDVGIAVMTADCLPVLFFSPLGKAVAAIHCGWRGLVNDLIANTINFMTSLGIPRGSIMMTLGPAIGPQSYEVGKEIYDELIGQDPSFAEAFVAKSLEETNGVPKFLLNLYKLAFLRYNKETKQEAEALCDELLKLKDAPYNFLSKESQKALTPAQINAAINTLKRAHNLSENVLPDFDTLRDHKYFYSYRQSKETGRMASIIVPRNLTRQTGYFLCNSSCYSSA